MTEESLFLAALEKHTPAERQAFLEEACGADATLRARVQMLLEADARARGIGTGDAVKVRSNGTSKELRARIARDLVPGLVRIPRDDAVGLHEYVEVSK